jgi:hypothetical protein
MLSRPSCPDLMIQDMVGKRGVIKESESPDSEDWKDSKSRKVRGPEVRRLEG